MGLITEGTVQVMLLEEIGMKRDIKLQESTKPSTFLRPWC